MGVTRGAPTAESSRRLTYRVARVKVQ